MNYRTTSGNGTNIISPIQEPYGLYLRTEFVDSSALVLTAAHDLAREFSQKEATYVLGLVAVGNLTANLLTNEDWLTQEFFQEYLQKVTAPLLKGFCPQWSSYLKRLKLER